MMRRHAELLVEYMGEERGCKEFRKHIAWYLKGFRAGGELRQSLGLVDTLATLDVLLSRLDPDRAVPGRRARQPARAAGEPAQGRPPRRLAQRPRRPRHRLLRRDRSLRG